MGVIPAQDPGPGKDKQVKDKLNTHKGMPKGSKTVTKKDLVPSGKGRHHRSVLGEDINGRIVEDTKRMNNGRDTKRTDKGSGHNKEKVSSMTK